jgi:hypothetical protein
VRAPAIALGLWALAGAARAEHDPPRSGDGLAPTRDGAVVRLTNTGAVPVLAVRAGDRTWARLAPGQRVDAPPDVPIAAGRFPLEQWGEALGDLGGPWAETHLRTAGFYLDAVAPGPEGVPARAANLRLLQTVDAQVAAAWVEPPALRLGLVARAARHVPPGPLLDRLLSAASPDVVTVWPPPYDVLEPLSTLLRVAIEAGGVAALPVLLAHPAWAADRGFDVPGLARAFGPEVGQPPAAVEADALSGALAAGDFAAAARAGVAAALEPSTTGDRARLACAALDVGAQRAVAAERLLAAEAYLRLAAPLCGETPAFRLRAASLLRAQGDRAHAGADLAGAVDWYRGALFLGDADADRARLADTLADLALARFREDALTEGRVRLDEAREVDPLRPKVLAALDAAPSVDPRARVALVLVILFLLVFAVRRLRRVLRPRGEGTPRLR